jgi:peptidyl-prolyl cis-trans isomerase C
MFKHKAFHKDSGNAVVIALVVLAIIAVGGLAYFSARSNKNDNPAAQVAGTPVTVDGQQVAAGEGEDVVIKPGNPTVAKVGSEEISRLDVFNFIQQLPPSTRQLPVGQLFPMALEQVVNARVIKAKTAGVNLDNDPEVQKQMGEIKENVVRNVYIQKQVDKKITEERLKAVYDQYVANFPKDIEEVKARHMLLKDEDKAKDLIKQLDGGADFAELAKANSTDGTAESGGELGFFSKPDVVPAFADAAFSLDVGSYTKKPVKTDFGYHIIKTEEKRMRPPASFEEAKPFLEAQLRQALLAEVIQEWRQSLDIQHFDINGEPVATPPAVNEPSAGTETPPASEAPAAETPPAP